MIRKYIFGRPFETEAVIKSIENAQCFTDCPERFPYGTVTTGKGGFEFSYTLVRDDMIFGLGEAMRGINKRGFSYISWCSDVPTHTEDRQSLYGAHNFIIIYPPAHTAAAGKNNSRPESRPFGLFFDYPGEIKFDAGFTKKDELKVSADNADMAVYVIDASGGNPGAKANESVLCNIVREFRTIIGQSYIPPFWAFGYQQSRWGYKSETDVAEVCAGYRKAGIPLDAVYLDIDYMDGFRDFTVDKSRFPDFAGFIKKLNDDGIHAVPIIDAGVKADSDYSVDNEGIKNGFFCKRADGSIFTAGVWPGKSHFPDFLNPEARRWFGSMYKTLLDAGADGFWNDMNEPALFYSESGITEIFSKLSVHGGNTNPDVNSFFDVRDKIYSASNNHEDYKTFYHRVPAEKAGAYADTEGTEYVSVRHDKIHNLYGYNMTRAAAEFFKEEAPDKRILLFSRASYIGMHRYGGIWTGDNCSWWSHLLLSIKMMPSLNMCGFLYTGSDIGGFGADASRDLLLRWLEFSIFTPLMRNHSALGTREQECYRFENPEDFRAVINLRYRLIPYLYSEFLNAAYGNEMYFRPLAFDYPEDLTAVRIEDQLMVGRAVMVAPVYEQNAYGRTVYLPEDMIQITCRPEDGSCETGTPEQILMKKGLHYIEVPLNTVVFFIKKGCAIPVCRPALCTRDLNTADLDWWGDKSAAGKYSFAEFR